MAKKGGHLHQPTAAELAAREEKKRTQQNNGRTRAQLGCGCRGGYVGPPGKKRPCPKCNGPKQGSSTGRKPRKPLPSARIH